MIHDHDTTVIDNDHHFMIDPITRMITTESPKNDNYAVRSQI